MFIVLWAVELVVIFAVRLAIGRAFGIRGLSFVPSFKAVDMSQAKRGARLAILGAVVTSLYLLSVALYVPATFGAGKVEFTNRIHVIADKPAARAGLRDGDRVLSIGGTATPDFPAITGAVRAAHGSLVDLEIERDGARLHLSATPEPAGAADAKLGINGVPVTTSYPVAEAFNESVVFPFTAVKAYAEGLLVIIRPRPTGALVGPVWITSAAATAAATSAPMWTVWLTAMSAWNAAVGIPVSFVIALILLPRRRREPS